MSEPINYLDVIAELEAKKADLERTIATLRALVDAGALLGRTNQSPASSPRPTDKP